MDGFQSEEARVLLALVRNGAGTRRRESLSRRDRSNPKYLNFQRHRGIPRMLWGCSFVFNKRGGAGWPKNSEKCQTNLITIVESTV